MIITLYNQKGGVGKSTIAANLSIKFNQIGKSVLLVDADSQGSMSDFHKIRSSRKDRDTFPVNSILTPTLHKDLKKYSFEVIVVDSSARDSMVSRSAVLSSDVVLIPMKPSGLDFWSTEGLFDFLEEARIGRENLKIIGVLNMVPAKTKIMEDVLETISEYEKKHHIKFLTSFLGNRLVYSYAMMDGLSVIESDNKKATDEFESFFKEFVEVINGS